jgi:hypothetical protein
MFFKPGFTLHSVTVLAINSDCPRTALTQDEEKNNFPAKERKE